MLGALARPQAETRGSSVKQLIEHMTVSLQSLTAIVDRLVRVPDRLSAGPAKLQDTRRAISAMALTGEFATVA
jgi:hypothetical protein